MRRGPYAKGAAKRAEILDVALEVVARLGCRKASNREIAERVGLTQAGLMHYFSSREDLYQAVIRERDIRDVEEFYAGDPCFESFLAVIAHNTQVPGLVQLYAEFSAEASIPAHPAHDFFVERYEWVRRLLLDAVAKAKAAGELGPAIDVDQAVDLIIASADGLQVQWLLDPSVDMVQRLRNLWDMIRRSSWSAGSESAGAAVSRS